MILKPAGQQSLFHYVCLFLAGCACLASASAGASTASISAEQWNSRPRSAQSVMALEPVAAAVQLMLVMPQSRLVLTYPSGEEGVLWAAELRGWLISLGIASADIEMVADSPEMKEIRLEVVPTKDEKSNAEVPNHE